MPLTPPKKKEKYNRRAAGASVYSAAKQTHVVESMIGLRQAMSSRDLISGHVKVVTLLISWRCAVPSIPAMFKTDPGSK